MANKNFEVKHGLSVGGTERISSAGVITGSLASATTATTQSALDNSTKIATTAYTDAAITAVIGGAPGTLDTLNELAAAINDDASYATTLTTALATKAPIASPTFTGTGRMNGDWVVGAATGEDKFVTAPQAAGSGTILISYNDAGNAYEPLKVDFETLDLRTSGTPRISIASNGDIDLGDTTVKADGQLLVNLTSSDVGASVNAIEADGGFRFRNGNWGIKNNDGSYETWLARSLTGNKTIYGEKLTVDVGNSRVGINTTSPGRTLDVKGSVQFSVNTNTHETFVFSTQGVDEAKQIMKNAANVSTIVLNTNGVSYVNGGNFGIGTDTPVAPLHVYNSSGGDATDKATMLSQAVMKLQPHTTNSTNMLFAQVDNGSSMGIQVTNGSATANWDLSLSPFGGHVGIGNVDPGARLHITHQADISMSAGADGHLKIEGNGYTGAVALNADGMHIYQNSSARSIIFGNNETEQVRIKHNGYVGIGTDNPLDLLHLNTTSGDVRQLMNAPTGSDAEIKFSEGGNVQYTIGHDAGSSEFRIGGTNVDSDVFLRAKSAGAGTNISIGRGGEEDGLAGLQVMRGGVLINGGYGDMGAINSHYTNVWTWVGCSGLGGTFNGAVRVNIPNPTGGASGLGYGGFSMEVYVAGYSGKYCHAFLSGYTNNGITLSENAIRASSGGWSTSYSTITSQGFYFDINYPSGLIHPSIYIRVSKGGHTAGGRGTDFNDVNVTWS